MLDIDKKEDVFLREVLNGKNFYDVKYDALQDFFSVAIYLKK